MWKLDGVGIQWQGELPTLNVNLVRDLLRWAAKDEAVFDRFLGEWNQELWALELRNGVCQSSYCMAGQAVVQAGYGILYEDDTHIYECGPNMVEINNQVLTGVEVHRASQCAPQVVTGTDDKGNPVYEPVTEHAEEIEVVATRVLGLTPGESYRFFEAYNKLEDLVRLANAFARARGLDVRFD